MGGFELRTDRLVVREWRDADREPFAQMNADPVVMELFPRSLQPSESDALVDRFEDEFASSGFCPWAVELAATGRFIGYVGLHSVGEVAFFPAVEVGWHLVPDSWGNGYATEAAASAMRFGFEALSLSPEPPKDIWQSTLGR